MSWPFVTLGEVATFINGDRGKNYPSKGSFVESGVAFINAGSLSLEHRLIDSELNYITQDKYDSLRSGKVEKGDILFCLRGSLGKFAVVENDIKGAVASSLVIIRANHKVALSYLKHYLGSVLCAREIDTFENGAAQPNLSATDLKSFKIPLPPLEEQKRIAAILDKADAIRQKRKQAIALADEFLRSVFLDMFGDPVTNPKGWEVRNLGDICQCINGDRSKNYPSGDDLVDDGVLFLSTKNIVNGELDLAFQQYITEEKFGALGRGKLLPDDMVITLRGTLAQCALFSCGYNTGFINAQLMIVRAGDQILPKFLHSLMMSRGFNRELKALGNGAAIPQLTAKQINELKIILPPLDIQEKFVAIQRFTKKVALKQVQAPEMFSSLSQKAFSGQL
ncbi:restriction endonuclease subunit S [Vibrio sp. V1B]|uniref:restriction endonuclease subunit S n=1 Tax=Vibrio harveyi group TaxID=717610 RepID=UPI00039A7398|nr:MULTISPECIES: restriction endonuclease subunit S [Vibrio harveyi group]PAW11848.1 restriction endonuclease subunit S [Vibrio sp. V1B]